MLILFLHLSSLFLEVLNQICFTNWISLKTICYLLAGPRTCLFWFCWLGIGKGIQLDCVITLLILVMQSEVQISIVLVNLLNMFNSKGHKSLKDHLKHFAPSCRYLMLHDNLLSSLLKLHTTRVKLLFRVTDLYIKCRLWHNKKMHII